MTTRKMAKHENPNREIPASSGRQSVSRSSAPRWICYGFSLPLALSHIPGSYIDTVCLWLPRLMTKAEFRPLRLALFRSQGDRKRRLVFKKRYRPDRSWFFTLYVHQPTRAALDVLADTLTPFRVIEVHIALDLPMRTPAEAKALHAHVEARFLKSARPTGRIHRVMGTAYFGRGTRRGSEVAMYSDKPSKAFPPMSCLHVEWRLLGAKVIRGAGLHTIAGLIDLHHRNFWEPRFRLWQPLDEAALLRIKQKQLGWTESERAEESTRRLVRMVARWASGPSEEIAVHDLLWVLRRTRLFRRPPMQLFKREVSLWALPAQGNALWLPTRQHVEHTGHE